MAMVMVMAMAIRSMLQKQDGKPGCQVRYCPVWKEANLTSYP
jgi:hypothetical protein